MNHSQLKAFHAVAMEGSFTKGAASLRISQPTLSGHVKALEEGYGVVLFQRGSREVVMTDFGQVLFEVTQRYFASETEARSLLTAAKGLIRGRLRLAADSPFITITLLANFSRRYPSVKLDVNFGNTEEILRGLLANDNDIGILTKVPHDKRLQIVPFRRDRLVVFVDRGHAWSQRRSIKLKDIADQTLITREIGSSTRAVFEKALAKHGVQPKDVFEIESREAVSEAVASGLGVGVVSEAEFGHDNRLHKLHVADVKLKVTECVAFRVDRKGDRMVSAFLELVGESVDL